MMDQSRAESTTDTYHYGQYLNQFPPNTIKVIREFERIQKKICRHKMSIMFNEICIYIYIYIWLNPWENRLRCLWIIENYVLDVQMMIKLVFICVLFSFIKVQIASGIEPWSPGPLANTLLIRPIKPNQTKPDKTQSNQTNQK